MVGVYVLPASRYYPGNNRGRGKNGTYKPTICVCVGAEPFAAGATALTGRGLSSNVMPHSHMKNEHLISKAQLIAKEILDGKVAPYEGGRRIWRECQLALERGDHRLDPFVYWSSEYEETTDTERQALCYAALCKAASLLIQNGSAL